jgi:hypothetical protein
MPGFAVDFRLPLAVIRFVEQSKGRRESLTKQLGALNQRGSV